MGKIAILRKIFRESEETIKKAVKFSNSQGS